MSYVALVQLIVEFLARLWACCGKSVDRFGVGGGKSSRGVSFHHLTKPTCDSAILGAMVPIDLQPSGEAIGTASPNGSRYLYVTFDGSGLQE